MRNRTTGSTNLFLVKVAKYVAGVDEADSIASVFIQATADFSNKKT